MAKSIFVDSRIFDAYYDLKAAHHDKDWDGVAEVIKLLGAALDSTYGITREEVIKWLAQDKRETVTVLALRLGVSRQTVYKTIRQIRATA